MEGKITEEAEEEDREVEIWAVEEEVKITCFSCVAFVESYW